MITYPRREKAHSSSSMWPHKDRALPDSHPPKQWTVVNTSFSTSSSFVDSTAWEQVSYSRAPQFGFKLTYSPADRHVMNTKKVSNLLHRIYAGMIGPSHRLISLGIFLLVLQQ